MSYLAYWKFSRSPFTSNTPHTPFFRSGSVAEAIARCEFLIQHGRRLGILVSPSGCGKSSLLKHLCAGQAKAPRQVATLVEFSGASPVLLGLRIRDGLLGESAPEAWLNTQGRSESLSLGRILHEVDDLLLASAAVGRQGVLLFDNSEDAQEETLETLGILLKRPGNWTAILSVDEARLVDLPRKILEACELRIDLPPWDLGLTAEYFESTLSKCGKRDDIFTAQGITRVHELADGIPRRINQIADMALIAGAAQRLHAIDSDVIDQVFDEFSLSLSSVTTGTAANAWA